MNKRSLIFFVVLSASMLVTNLFFKPKVKASQPKAAIEQQEALRPSLESKIASKAELPLVDIYKDEEGKKLLTTALLFNDQIMTLSWDDDLPESVYFKKSYSSFPLEKASPTTKTAQVGDPVLLTSGSANKVAAAELPKSGSYSLQLVEPKAYKANQEITPATYSNGQVLLPEKHKLNGNAVALAKGPQGNYEPVGIYVKNENRIISLNSFDALSAHMSLHKFSAPQRQGNEQFYVLENDQQQLVFSNYGGAIAEINLPLNDKDHKDSKVYSLEFDDMLKEKESPHSLFPTHDYHVASGGKKAPKKGGYYPMIRRNVGSPEESARFYAFNIVSSYPEISELPYKVTHFSKNKIVFESNQSHRKIIKTYTLDKNSPYGMDLAIKTEGDNADLWLSTGVPEVELISNMQSPVIKYRQQNKKNFKINKQKLPKESVENTTISPDWISNSNSFFTLLVDPQDQLPAGYKVNKVKGTALPSRIASLDLQKKVKNTDGYECLVPLDPSSKEIKFKIFAGPLEKSLLAQADQQNATSSDYLGAQTYNGFLNFVSEPVAKFLFIFLNMFHKLTTSWGLSIILLTILLRVILFPLNSWSIKAMRRNQEIAPEISAIQQKYKKTNPKQAQIEIMKLYRKRKVNPFTGCLPMVIQMPFLIGMFSLLRSAFVLRGVPFIGGWINSLTAPDVLFTWSQSIPFFGTQFHLLPIISCVMIWLQQKVASPLPVDKSQMTDQQKQQKMMSYFMLVFVTLLCYNLPSGLNLYFISSTLLGIVQQWITNRMLDKKKNEPTIIDKKKTPLKGSEA